MGRGGETRMMQRKEWAEQLFLCNITDTSYNSLSKEPLTHPPGHLLSLFTCTVSGTNGSLKIEKAATDLQLLVQVPFLPNFYTLCLKYFQEKKLRTDLIPATEELKFLPCQYCSETSTHHYLKHKVKDKEIKRHKAQQATEATQRSLRGHL